MEFMDKTCSEFIEVLASSSPFPGGGGASALVGAIGIALGNMVGSLTLGKKKYDSVQNDIIRLKEKADALQKEFLYLVEEDAVMFEPLSKAYQLPKDTIEQRAVRDKIMEEALKNASTVPLEIMKKCCEAIELIKEFSMKGTKVAISDAGCGASFCRAALESASLNVFINTKLMTDIEWAREANVKANAMLEKYIIIADEIINDVRSQLQRTI